MAKSGNSGNGNSGNGNSGTGYTSYAGNTSYTGNTGNTGTTGQSGTSGNGKGNAGSTNTSTTNASTGATNSAGLMGSLIGFGNNITGNVGNTYGGGSDSGNNNNNNNDSENNLNLNEEAAKLEAAKKNAEKSNDANVREYHVPYFKVNNTPYDIQLDFNKKNNKPFSLHKIALSKEQFKKGTDDTTITNAPAVNNAPADNSTSETAAPSISETLGGAANTGVTYRGGTVSTPSGTSVTDSGTGGSISSSITTPTRDASSIGLGVYNNDRANYDQDNWNRGMESESSSLVSDEECKTFAKRAFMENSEPFKKVKITIIKNVR